MEELFGKNIQEITKILLDAWKLSELRLVGKFIQTSDKLGFFEDIRTTDYVNLFYPANVESIADEKLTIFTYVHPHLNSGIYYEFNAVLQAKERRKDRNNPFLLRADFSNNNPIEFKPNPKTFIQRRYEIAKNTPLLTQDQLSKSIDTITSDINKKPETFIYELLQNADDYPQPSLKKVEVVFRINNSFLQFMHSGLPFSVKNVHAICGVNEKDKGDDIEKIGFKGIGFKSVFKDSDYALIKSGGFQFRFDEKHHSTKTYWQTIPIWTETEEFDKSLITNEFLNAPVSIALKPKNSRVLLANDDSYAVTLKTVFADPKILLFLRHVNEVSVVIPNEEVIFCSKNLKDWWKKSEKIKVSEEQKIELNKMIIEPKLRDKRIPEKFYNLNESWLSFATRKQWDRIIKTENSKLYVYLPTQIDLKFPFLINGDFIPDASREELHNNISWNDYLMQEAGFMFVKWLKETGSNRWKDRNDIEIQFNRDYVDLTPDFTYCKNSIDNKHHYLIDAFNRGFDKAIKELAFIPDYDNQLRRLDEILIDETGLLELLGIEEFRATVNNGQYPIHKDLQANDTIRRLLSDYYLDSHILRDETITKWVEDQPDEWFQNIENNARFLNLLAEKGWFSVFENWNIFLDHKNELKTADEIHDSFGIDFGLLNWLPISYINEEVVKLLNDKVTLPIKQYIPIVFIKDYVLPKKSEVNTLLEAESNNRKFYRFLFKHQKDILKEELYKDLKDFKVWGNQNDYISSFNSNIYLYDENLEKLLKANVFPDKQVYMLPQNFFGPIQEWNDFFKNFGAQQYEATNFVKTEIIGKAKGLEEHFNDYEDFDEGETPNESYLQKKSTNAQLWAYIHGILPKFSGEDIEVIKKQLGDLTVFTSEHCTTKALKECWLSEKYTGDNTISGLVEKFETIAKNVSFVSFEYLSNRALNQSEWRKLFKDCKCQTDEKEFVSQIKEQFSVLSENNIVEATKLLFKYKAIENVELRIKLVDGSIVSPEKAVVSSYYTETDWLETTLPSIPISNSISSDYDTGKKKDWVDFFRSLGAKFLDSETQVISHKINYLIDNQEIAYLKEKHFEIFKDLVNLNSFNKNALTTHYSTLGQLKLRLKYPDQIIEAKAQSLFFSTDYETKLDFLEQTNPQIIISPDYLDGNSYLEVKAFLTNIGVHDNFYINTSNSAKNSNTLHAYCHKNFSNVSSHHTVATAKVSSYNTIVGLEFVKDVQSATFFWDFLMQSCQPEHFEYLSTFSFQGYVDKRNYSYKIPSPFVLEELAITLIPTETGKVSKPSELYSLDIANYVTDKSKLPAIDLRQIQFNNQSLEKHLGFKVTLSDTDCLAYIRTEPKKSEYFNSVVEMLASYNSVSYTETFKEFKKDGKWLNLQNQWMPLHELVFLDSNSLERTFGKNEHLIKFPTNIPPAQRKKICIWIGVPILTENSFKIVPEDKKIDEKFRTELSNRLELIAFDAFHDEDWQSKLEGYRRILSEWQFYTCSKISISYQSQHVTLNVSAHKLYEHKTQLTKELWYVKSWDDNKVLIDLVSEISDNFRFEQKKDVLLDFFSERNEIIKQLIDKGLNVPQNWVDELKNPQPKIPTNPQSNYPQSTDSNPKVEESLENKESEIYSPIVERIIKGLDGLKETSQQGYHKEAAQAGLQWLENNGWNLNNAQTNKLGELENTINSDNQSYTIIIRSAKAGLLRLDQYSWTQLGITKYQLLVKTGDSANDFRIYRSQQDLLDDPKNEKNVIVKQNTKNPETLTEMVKNLKDEDKAHLYFVSNQEGTSIFESLVKSKSSGEAGTADESDLF